MSQIDILIKYVVKGKLKCKKFTQIFVNFHTITSEIEKLSSQMSANLSYTKKSIEKFMRNVVWLLKMD